MQWTELISLIKTHHEFCLTTHLDPDGDGLGSAFALADLLLSLGKQARVVLDQPIPQRYAFLDNHGVGIAYSAVEKMPEVLGVLDTHRRDRIGAVSRVLAAPGVRSFCLDHHPPTQPLAEVNLIDPQLCCTGILVFDLFEKLGRPLSLAAANGIYASILCDTGRFAHGCQDGRAYHVAEECLRAGVDPDDLNARLFHRIPVEHVRWFAGALQKLESYEGDRILFHTFTEEDLRGIGEVDLEYVHEFHKLVQGVECIVLMRELPGDQVRISARSRGDLDIGAVMRSCGGGGHARAAGATCPGKIQDLKPQVLNLLKSNLPAL